MNTVQKGNLFEEKAKDIIIAAINNGQLGLIPSCCKVISKASYFSKDRDGNIIFDLSIEVWPEGAERCHLLYLIECKDYTGHSVPVNDIEEFVSKINQVAGIKAKGVFITSSKLQESAFKFAKAKDLMLIQVDASQLPKIILHNSKRNKKNIQTDYSSSWLEEIELLERIGDIFQVEDGPINNWDEAIERFLYKQLNNTVNWHQPGAKAVGLERLSKKIIEKLSEKMLKEFAPTVVSHGTDFPIELFLTFIKEKYDLNVICDEAIPLYKGKKLNGYCDIEQKTIYVDKELVGTGQFLFVCAHELAHFILHSKIIFSQGVYDKAEDSQFDKTMGRHALLNEKHWLEWQANQFAAALIMPHRAVLIRLIKWQISQGISRVGSIWLDSQSCNIFDFKKMLTILGYEFGVSRTILEYRMADLGMITYDNSYHNLRHKLFNKTKAPETLAQVFSQYLN